MSEQCPECQAPCRPAPASNRLPESRALQRRTVGRLARTSEGAVSPLPIHLSVGTETLGVCPSLTRVPKRIGWKRCFALCRQHCRTLPRRERRSSSWLIWLCTQVLSSVRVSNRFGGGRNGRGADGRDLGIDRVVGTVDGELWAVQAKGYSASTSLKYGGSGGIATFLAAAASGQFALHMVVTSTDSVADNARLIAARQSVPTRILDRSWLESLDIDWPVDLSDLQTAVQAAQSGHGLAQQTRAAARHNLASHQVAAVHSVLASFEESAQSNMDVRAQLLMPCGTGKTLTCHGIAEQLVARHVLVLVPSLALLAQTMRAWQAQSRGRLRVVAVCSDESVTARGNDEIVVNPSELLAPVTTDAPTLAEFLSESTEANDTSSWPTVVFSTYHSSPVVAAAQRLIARRSDHQFDLVVADEAHYVAGKVSAAFATALHADELHAHPARRARRCGSFICTPHSAAWLTRSRDTDRSKHLHHPVLGAERPIDQCKRRP